MKKEENEMSYDSLLINTCSLVEYVKDKWGKKTSENVTAGVVCRIMEEFRKIVDEKGEERLSSAKVFFKPNATVGTHLYFRYGGVDRGIIKVLEPQDSVTLHHIEAYLT